MGKRISIDEALATARANRFGRMLGRGADNRLEPECWPNVEPGFHFTKDQKFFAIGSCFATNVSKRLALDGYNVHGEAVVEGHRRNRYTPPAIFQELAWAREIYLRDDVVRDEDVMPLLLDFGKDRWTDIWSRTGRAGPITLKAAIAARKELYAFFKGAFEADVVIITLGLIEAWWDQVSKTYVNFDIPWARRADRDRFQFERLSFDTCRDYIERTLKLVLDGDRRVLMTTSPVILPRTFTGNDIIVANSHSKSVLRAVCGELSDLYPNVDYFPSYEIATLTRRPEVWEDDLIHIQPNFIARIMQHVTNAYVPGSVGREDRTLMQMANLAEALQFDAAQQLYDGIGEAIWESSSPAVHAGAMKLAMARGNLELAARHALCLDAEDDLLYENHPDWMFTVSRALKASDDHQQRAGHIRHRLVAFGRGRPELFLFVEREVAGDDDAMRDLIAMIVAADVDSPILMHKACAALNRLGHVQESLDLADRQLTRTPENELMLARRARQLLGLKRTAEAVAPLRRLCELDAENAWARLTLARTLNKTGNIEEALAAVDDLLARSPSDAHALSLKARLLAKLGRDAEAAEAARLAIAAANGDATILRDVQPLLAKTAA